MVINQVRSTPHQKSTSQGLRTEGLKNVCGVDGGEEGHWKGDQGKHMQELKVLVRILAFILKPREATDGET